MTRKSVMDEARELQAVLEEETGTQPNIFDLATQVRRARRLNIINERWCNEEMSERTTAAVERLESSLEGKITAYFAALSKETGTELPVTTNGDPRGFPVKVRLPKSRQYNTWGGADDGWGFGVSND